MLHVQNRLQFFFGEYFNEMLSSTCNFNLINTVEPISPPFHEGMAGPTRLELAASGVTGQRSHQLNYDPVSNLGGRGLEPLTTGV